MLLERMVLAPVFALSGRGHATLVPTNIACEATFAQLPLQPGMNTRFTGGAASFLMATSLTAARCAAAAVSLSLGCVADRFARGSLRGKHGCGFYLTHGAVAAGVYLLSPLPSLNSISLLKLEHGCVCGTRCCVSPLQAHPTTAIYSFLTRLQASHRNSLIDMHNRRAPIINILDARRR